MSQGTRRAATANDTKTRKATGAGDRWVKPFFKQYKKALALALVLGLVAFSFAAALMFTSGYLIGRAAEKPESIMVLYIPLILVRVFGIGKPIAHYLERLTSHDWALRMTSSLRLKLYGSLEKDAARIRSTHRTGDILGLLAEDIGHIQNLYLRVIFPTVIAWLLYLIIVIACGWFSLWFGLALLLLIGTAVVVAPLASVLANRARQTRRKAMKDELYRELTDNVLGISDWVFAQRGHDYLSRYKALEGGLRETDAAMNRFSRRRDLALQALFGLAAVVILVWAGGYFGGVQGGASNWIAAFVLAFFPLVDAFAPLPSAAVEATAYRGSIDRLNELPDADERSSAQAPEVPKGAPLTISIEGMDFTYPEAPRPVFTGLDLVIGQGEKVAVLGRSGSGKSTLASLIRGDLEPDAGSVSLGGIPTSRFGDDMAEYIGIIQQQTYLFNDTLLGNLRVGRQDATEDEAWEVLEKAGLREMAERLPDGLHTMVDEAGLRFSGGERHRVALARVLLRKTPIIILDEPMVGLDPLTEQALLDTILDASASKTLILITHHLQGLRAMDRVILVEDGGCGLDGKPADLERESTRYRMLLEFDKGI